MQSALETADEAGNAKRNELDPALSDGSMPGLHLPPTDLAEHDLQSSAMEPRPDYFRNGFHEYICLVTLCMGPMLNSMSVGSVNIALPSIGRSLDIQQQSDLSWIISAFSLANGRPPLEKSRLPN